MAIKRNNKNYKKNPLMLNRIYPKDIRSDKEIYIEHHTEAHLYISRRYCHD